MGLSVSPSSLHKKKKELVKQQEKGIKNVLTDYVTYVESQNKNSGTGGIEGPEVELEDQGIAEIDIPVMQPCKPIEILGDNLDITVTPSKMSIEHQRKSLHWFLTMVKQKRFTYQHMNVSLQSTQSQHVFQSVSWMPCVEQLRQLFENMKFHIANILLKYITYLSPVAKCFPKYIEHEFMEKAKEKSVFLNCDLIDASENSSQGMIEILQKVHQLAVPHVRDNPDKTLLEKVVFGGDVLTNERAFTAQEAMQNSPSKFEQLCGVIHRPEGLHREMNFLLV